VTHSAWNRKSSSLKRRSLFATQGQPCLSCSGNSHCFMRPEDSLSYSQQADTGPGHEPGESSFGKPPPPYPASGPPKCLHAQNSFIPFVLHDSPKASSFNYVFPPVRNGGNLHVFCRLTCDERHLLGCDAVRPGTRLPRAYCLRLQGVSFLLNTCLLCFLFEPEDQVPPKCR
jgi:hypothetical protein